MYKAVFIDWDNTLGDFSNSALLAMKEIYATQRLDLYFDSFQQWFDIYSPHNLQLWEQYGQGLITKQQLSLDRFDYPFRVRGYNNMQDFALQIEDMFESLAVEYTQLIPHAREITEYLSNKYPLILITNGFPEIQHQKLRNTDMQQYFTHTIISEEVGYAKPNPKIFQIAQQACQSTIPQLTASDIIMIGDHYNVDIIGAQQAGIDQIYFCPDTAENAILQATYHVHNLLEIKQIL